LSYPWEFLGVSLGRQAEKGDGLLPFYFEDQKLDPEKGELSRRGQSVVVEPKVFDLLVYLIENRDRLVSKDDLILRLWGGRSISDSAVTSAINAARTAIGDNGRDQRLIRTSSRKGFRFVGLVGLSKPVDAGQQEPLADGNRGSASTLLAIPHLSMAVLPFANLSADPGQDYFVDAIVETLTTDLSRLSHSFVIARNTAFSYKNKIVPATQIGKELRVRYLIQGSVQCVGARLRVTVQLIDAGTGSHLWADRFDCDRGDMFQMQDEIVANLARMLDVELTSAESKRAALSSDPHSLDLTFRGWAAMYSGVNPERLKTVQFFEQALALDSRNIMALEGLADANSAMAVGFMTDNPAALLATTEAMAKKAVELAPMDAKAHASLALVYLWTNRVDQSISEYEHARELDRNLAFAHANVGVAKYVAGRPEETEDHVKRAIQLSPRDTWLNTWCCMAGVAQLALGRDGDATRWLHRAIEANPALPLAHFFLASALALQGKASEASAAAKAGLALDPAFTIQRYRSNPLSHNPSYLAYRDRIAKGMLLAGIPEGSRPAA
jgi:TolB-like protein/Tfp pilus assembly protein PilF